MARISRYTDDSDTYLKKSFVEGVSMDAIIEQLNTMRPEGSPLWNEHSVKYRVAKFRVFRPEWYRREVASKAALAHYAGIPSKKPKRDRSRLNGVAPVEYRQKPLPVELTLTPSKDGGISLSLMDVLREVANYDKAPCDPHTAAAWGRLWAKNSEDLRVINAKRMEYQLPVFEVRSKINA